jgi:hypothetical protein
MEIIAVQHGLRILYAARRIDDDRLQIHQRNRIVSTDVAHQLIDARIVGCRHSIGQMRGIDPIECDPAGHHRPPPHLARRGDMRRRLGL